MELSHGLLSGGMNKLTVSKFHKPPPVAKRTSSIPRGESQRKLIKLHDKNSRIWQKLLSKKCNFSQNCMICDAIFVFLQG